MLTPEERELLRRHVSIDGDGNVIGDDNTVRLTKQTSGDYAVQIGEQRISFSIVELRQALRVEHSQVDVVGDHARPQPVNEVTLTTAHEQHVARTFALSYERLDPQDPTDALALALLARAACFAPGEPIPCPLLLATLDLPEGDFEEAARLMRRALTIWEAALGPEHLNTQSLRRNLAAIEEQLQHGA